MDIVVSYLIFFFFDLKLETEKTQKFQRALTEKSIKIATNEEEEAWQQKENGSAITVLLCLCTLMALGPFPMSTKLKLNIHFPVLHKGNRVPQFSSPLLPCAPFWEASLTEQEAGSWISVRKSVFPC